MQKITLIHPVIQKLESHAHFWPQSPKNYQINSWLSWICIRMQKISSVHSSIHLVTRLAKTICVHTHPNIILSTFNLWYQHAKKWTISSLCSRDIFDLKSWNLIGQNCFGLLWLRSRLIDLLFLPLAKKMDREKVKEN